MYRLIIRQVLTGYANRKSAMAAYRRADTAHKTLYKSNAYGQWVIIRDGNAL